jgi:hypothetical protein
MLVHNISSNSLTLWSKNIGFKGPIRLHDLNPLKYGVNKGQNDRYAHLLLNT